MHHLQLYTGNIKVVQKCNCRIKIILKFFEQIFKIRIINLKTTFLTFISNWYKLIDLIYELVNSFKVWEVDSRTP